MKTTIKVTNEDLFRSKVVDVDTSDLRIEWHIGDRNNRMREGDHRRTRRKRLQERIWLCACS